jgi:PPOX class probable F420-dependent enzyme
MKTLTEEKKKFINEFLEEPLIARMATVDGKGQPHVVPVWYGWDGQSIWISSFSNTRKVNELKSNPKISVSIDASINGRTKAVILEGEVELVSEPGDFLRKQFHWIYERYLGEKGVMEKEPQGWIEDPQNLLIKLTPKKLFTWNW